LPKLIQAPIRDLIFPFILHPIFLYIVYLGIGNKDYQLAIGSLLIWFAITLLVINYWFRAFGSLVLASYAFYYKVWWLGLISVFLFFYLAYAAWLIDQGKLNEFAGVAKKLSLENILFLFRKK